MGRMIFKFNPELMDGLPVYILKKAIWYRKISYYIALMIFPAKIKSIRPKLN
jgi:hypothetical protein